MSVLRIAGAIAVVVAVSHAAPAKAVSRRDQDSLAEQAFWGKPLELDAADSDQFTGGNDDCQYTDPKTKAQFDLRPLVARRAHIIRGVTPSDKDSAHLQKFHEEGHDYSDYKTKNFRSTGYDYVLNICQNVHKRPSECKDKPFAPAYQVSASDVYGTQHPPGCYQLAKLDGWKFSLIDPTFPSTGVDLTYIGGEECMRSREVKNETGHTNVEWETTTRSITVRFLCDENESADIESILRMARRLTTTEPEMCNYRVEWPSVFGCPLNPTNAWKRTETAPRSSPLAADAPATASNKGFFGYLFGLIYFLVKWAFYVALFAWVVYAGIQIFSNWPAILAQKDRLLGFDVTTWKSVLRLLVPRSVGSVKTAVSRTVEGKRENV